jgi:hypothetical protein
LRIPIRASGGSCSRIGCEPEQPSTLTIIRNKAGRNMRILFLLKNPNLKSQIPNSKKILAALIRFDAAVFDKLLLAWLPTEGTDLPRDNPVWVLGALNLDIV